MWILKMQGDPVRYLVQPSGEKDSCTQGKVFPPGTGGTAQAVPPENRTACVQTVNDLPTASKLINDLKQNHVFDWSSRAAILFSHIISNFPFTDNHSFFIHLLKLEHKNENLSLSNTCTAEVHMVSENKQQFLVTCHYAAMSIH